MGCGWGTISFAMASRAREVVGIDFSRRAVDACNERLAQLGVENLSFLLGDACRTELDAADFDLVVAADFFEHLYPDDSETVTAEAFRLLRPGGRLGAWTPCGTHFLEVLRRRGVLPGRDPSHVDYKSMARMKELFVRAGFEIERAYFAESHMPGLRLLERACQRFAPPLRRRVAVLGRKPK